MAGKERCIGKLTLDITDIEPKVEKINKLLAQIGSSTAIKINIADEVKKQLSAIEAELNKSVKDIQAAAQNATTAFNSIGNSNNTKNTSLGTLKSEIVDTTSVVRNLGRSITSTGQTVEKIVGETTTGYNALGEKVREVTDAHGNLVRKVRDVGSQYKDALKIFIDYQSKLAQLTALDLSGKTNTPQYAKLYNEVESLAGAWKSVDDGVKGVVKSTDEAKIAAKTYSDTIAIINSGISDKSAEQALKNQVSLYEQWYKYLGSADTYAQKGDASNANMYKALADGVKTYIDAIAQLNPALDAQAQAEQKVIQAHLQYETTLNSNVSKENEANVKAYVSALVDLYNEQTKLNNALASGKITEGSKEYDAVQTKIKHFEEAVASAGSKLDAAGIKAANSMQQVVSAADSLVQSQARMQDSEQTDWLERATNAYNNLKNAVNQYNIAKKAKNDQGMATWQAEIDKQMAIVSGLQTEIQNLNVDAETREKILTLIQQCVTLQDAQQKGVVGTTGATGELEQTLMSVWTRMFGLIAIIRKIKQLITDTVDYVSSYYDKMNEIQIITQKSSAEVEKLADDYRRIAEYMNVSTLDIADAAIYFTRQGLAAEEIERRLKNITMYAKTANVEFTEASELITAVVNSMGLVEEEAEDGRNAVQRVSDVFLNVGDHAATSGREIAEAMQKAAASAGAFGMSFEWLASYIATVSETTRQEARTIGTAFNTIIARLHQIKQSGYNNEDTTKVNDIAKALSRVGIQLMDNNNEWRDMTVIFQELGDVWGTLDGKTRSYIATTMAGVKQQNVFLALMNDLGKGIEGGSRAWELYDLAINSAGTSEEKYATYLDSVTAAQERLTLAQEKFYSLLSADVIKGWYDGLAKVVTWITKATSGLNGLNIVIPILIGLIILLANAINTAGTASAFFASIWESHPVLMVITAVAASIVALSAAVGSFTQTEEDLREEFDKASETLDKHINKLKTLQKTQQSSLPRFEELADKAHLSTEEVNEQNEVLERLAEVSPRCAQAVDNLKNGFITSQQAAEIFNDELERIIKNEKDIALNSAIDKYTLYRDEDEQSITNNASSFMNLWNRWYGVDKTEKVAGTSVPYTYRKIDLNYKNFEEQLPYLLGYAGNINDSPSWENPGTAWSVSGKRNLIYDYGRKLMQQAESYGVPEDQRYGYVGKELWRWLFGTTPEDTSSGPMDVLRGKVEEEIDNVMSIVGEELSPLEQMAARRYLSNSIFGDDDELDIAEYNQFSDKIVKFLVGFKANGMDSILISTKDVFDYVANEIWGDYFEVSFSDAALEKLGELSKDDVFVENFATAYEEMVKAGFSTADIRKIFEEIPLEDWDSAALIVRQRVMDRIAKKVGLNQLGDMMSNEDDEEEYDSLMWGDLDLSTLNLIEDMVKFGISIDDIQDIMRESNGDVEVFNSKLKTLGETAGYVSGETEEAAKSISNYISEIKAGQKDIEKIDAVIEKIGKNEPITTSDLFDIAQMHPEILAVIGDSEALLDVLKRIRDEKSIEIVASVKDMVYDDATIAQHTPFDVAEGQTLRQYQMTLDKTSDEYWEVADYVDKATMDIIAATGNLNQVARDNLIEWEKVLLGQTNIDVGNRKQIDAADLTAAGWEGAGEGYATLFSQTMSAGNRGKQFGKADFLWEESVVVNFTPILPNGKVLTPQEAEEYLAELFDKSASVDELFANDDKKILISVGYVEEDERYDEAMDRESKRMEMLHELEEAIYAVNDAEKSWLQTLVEESNLNAENEWAKSNGFIQQIGEMRTALSSGNVEDALAIWDSYDRTMQESIAKTYPELAAAILDAKEAVKDEADTTGKAAKAHEKLNTALSNSARYAKGSKAFGGTLEALQKLRAGTISATDAYEVFNKELDTVTKAGEEITDVQAKMAAGTEVTANDVNNLAKVLGVSAETILADFPAAVAMFDELTGAGGELINIFDELNKAAFIRITGTSEADFSNIQNGLISVQNMAQETIDLLTATGQWKVETVPVNTRAWVRGEDGSWTLETLTSNTEVLVPTGNNPFGGRKSGGSSSSSNNKKSGSGGGGNRNRENKGPTEIEKMLDVMNQNNSFQEYQKGYYNAQQNYYSGTGQLQGVIQAAELEKSVVEGQNKTIEGNISKIEELMAVKRKELATMSESDERYAEVAGDLDKLQQAHQKYTQEVIENNTRLNELNETIEEQKKKIRDMEIDIRNLIYKAIEDREKKKKDMLNAEVEMENKILDVIKKRYEKERDQLIDITNKRIEALQEERDLLSEQLQLRKEQAEEEDKQKKLEQLELQYQRISADPTRAKEAKKIQEEITALRKEMAWDAAEKEVEAQQKSIDQQINSLEDYIEYVNSYYEELFNNPKELIKEMKEVMSMTDDEIIEWLKNNDEEYATATVNRRKQLVESWEGTLDTMRGTVKTYWEEVEEIIKKGDDYIINFLKENSGEYAQAGKLQAEAYVEEWKEKLENLKKAHEQVAASIAQTYTVIPNVNTSSGSSSSGGGGSGGGTNKPGGNTGGNEKRNGSAPYMVYGANPAGQQTRLAPQYNSFSAARSAARKALGQGWQYVYIASSAGSSNVVTSRYGDFGKAFKKGGLADYTGPAWVDGSRENPEAVLNPYQTKLFQTMVEAMERMSSISVPTMPNYGELDLNGASGASIGDIIVNVDNLDTDDDYETLAKKVSEVLMERIGRTTVVGGLRIN